MAHTMRDVMTANPRTLSTGATAEEAARIMRDEDVGVVVVVGDGDEVRGVVTDRDIAVRVVAEGKAPTETTLADVASQEEIATLSPDDGVDDAIRLMREKKVRRVPIVEGGRAVGIVSLGDLAVDQQPDSALADISAADPNE